MSDETILDAVETYLPYDGPHTRYTVRDGAAALSAIVRYLNNATGPGNGQRTLEWAATVNAVLSNVTAATYGLDQLFGQLVDALERQASTPELALYDDRRSPDHPADITARTAANELRDARDVLDQLGRQLEVVRSYTHHLGND